MKKQNNLKGIDRTLLDFIQHRKSASLYEIRSHLLTAPLTTRNSINSLKHKGLIVEEGDIISYVS